MSTAVEFAAWTCAVCSNPIIGTADSDGKILSHIPDRSAPPDYPDVPDDIRDDAVEAHDCASVKAWRAAVVMARRALQTAALRLEAPDTHLVAQIDWLEERRLITPQMRRLAHRVRLTGNVGAHPDRDGLADVRQEDAEAVLVFLDEFLRYLFTIPAALEAAERRSTS